MAGQANRGGPGQPRRRPGDQRGESPLDAAIRKAQRAEGQGGRRCPVYGTTPPASGCERCVFGPNLAALENAARAGIPCALNPEAGA